MGNPEHVKIVLRGKDAIEEWRKENPGVVFNLRWADLRGAKLSGADLSGAYLQGAYLQGAYLQGADLRGADFSDATIVEGWTLTKKEAE